MIGILLLIDSWLAEFCFQGEHTHTTSAGEGVG